MVFKRRIYIAAVVLAVFFATVMIAFIVHKDKPDDFKGTLVKSYTREVFI